MDPTLHTTLSTALEALDAAHRRRRLRPLSWRIEVGGGALCDDQGRTLIDASSNDYLGLSQHPLTRRRAAEWAERHGAGAPASRLITGTREITAQVEAKLAAFKASEAALLFPTGFQLNATVIPALCELGPTTIFSDALNHASLVHGCRLAKASKQIYRHNDLDHLESLLRENSALATRDQRRLIVTETVFSMDGDRAPLAGLLALAERYGAALYVDEAHATGALGPGGRGLAAESAVAGRIDLVMGTLGKGLGAFGAYVTGSQALIDFLLNRAAGFIYTTALPPAVLGAVDAALDLLPTMDVERATLAAHAERLRLALRSHGIDTRQSSTQIIPAVLGDEATTLTASQRLYAAGILAVAIRPPTVPVGTSRLRYSLHAGLRDEAMAQLCASLAMLTLKP